MTTKTSRARTRAKLELLWRDGRRCAICGKKIKNLDDLTIDHIIPLAKGGENVLENYQLAHRACNETKADMLPDEHVRLLKCNRRRILWMRIRKGIVVW